MATGRWSHRRCRTSPVAIAADVVAWRRDHAADRSADDDDLIRRVAAGDCAAWRALVRAHLAAIVGYAWHRLGDAAEAEDIAQETFIRLLGKVGTWRRGGPGLRAWLYRVATNLCIDRRRGERPLSLDALADAGAVPADPGDLDTGLDRSRAVRHALAQLPQRQSTALILVHYQGLSGQEAAAALEVSVEALESLLSRGRRALRRRLAPLVADLLGAQ